MNYIDKESEIRKEAKINEQQIIFYSSLSKERALEMFSSIKEDWILDESIRKVYLIIKDSILNNKDLYSRLGKEGVRMTYANCLCSRDNLTASFDNIVKEQKDLWKRYQLVKTLQKYNESEIKDPSKTISEIWDELSKIADGQDFERTDMDYILELFETEHEEYKNKEYGELIGHKSGFKAVDENIDGLRNGHLWIVGGYTSMGKTQFVLNIANKLIEQDVKVSVFSLEMSKVDILKRMLGIYTGKNGSLFLKSDDPVNVKEKNRGLEYLKKSGMRIHTEKFDLKDIIMSMTIEKKTSGVGAFIIDYAQLVKADGKSLYDDMRNLANKLQNFCRKENVPVILVSQVSNESAKNDTHIIGYKGAGDLGASADLAIELKSGDDRDEKERKIANNESISVIIQAKKNRHGKVFNDEVYFQPMTGQFFESCPDPANQFIKV